MARDFERSRCILARMKTVILVSLLLSATSLSAAPSRTPPAAKSARTVVTQRHAARKTAPAPAAPSTRLSTPVAQEESGGCFSCYFSLASFLSPIPYELTLDGQMKTELCKAKYCN
jgi:hypothetical protein